MDGTVPTAEVETDVENWKSKMIFTQRNLNMPRIVTYKRKSPKVHTAKALSSPAKEIL